MSVEQHTVAGIGRNVKQFLGCGLAGRARMDRFGLGSAGKRRHFARGKSRSEDAPATAAGDGGATRSSECRTKQDARRG